MALCSNPDCKIEETGKCIEGFTILEDCPTYGKELEELATEAVESSTTDEGTITQKQVTLHSGDTLISNEVDLILKKHDGKIIACVGPSNIGKTTLLASFYELFSQGSMDEFIFGGSQTLFAYEAICHHSRAASQNMQPNTPRTTRQNQASFYHIALKHRLNNTRIDLLLGDRAGEEYEAAIDNKEDCIGLYEVNRSDVLLLLVDGKALGDNKARHVAKNKADSLIRAFKEDRLLGDKSKIIIVMTRYDLAFQEGNSDKAMAELGNLLGKIQLTLSGTNIEVSTHVVAARPDGTENVKVAYGIPELIKIIVNTDTQTTEYKLSNNCGAKQSLRSFQNLRDC